MTSTRFFLIGITLLFILPSATANACEQRLPDAGLKAIGQRIFINECNAKTDCLVDWNPGEAFPSLGIGHFIWYPAGVHMPFVESFPLLVQFYRQQQESLPEWLDHLTPFQAPWPDRTVFLKHRNDPHIETLRQFLLDTRDIQVRFLLQRMQNALQKIVQSSPIEQQDKVQQRIDDLCGSAAGQYALIDYVNFKGEGLSPKEQYFGKGWGLKQVILGMEGIPVADQDHDKNPVVLQFSRSAETVLTERALHAPNDIEQDKWLPGWIKRVRTYPDFHWRLTQ